MIITIFLDEKSKQVIKVSDKFWEKKTYGEQYQAVQSIAKDISKGSYLRFEFSN